MLRKPNNELNDRIFNKTGKKQTTDFDYILPKKSSPEWNGVKHRHELPATFIKLILLVVVVLIRVAKHN